MYWSLHGDIRVPVVDRQRCVVPALPFLNVSFLETVATWDPHGFPAARPFSHGRNLGICTVKATQKWEGGLGHKRNMRSSHMSVPERISNRYSKTVARTYQRDGEPQCIKVLHGQKVHNSTVNKLIVLNKFIDEFSTIVGITEDWSSSNKTSMRVKRRNTSTLDGPHKDVREGRHLRLMTKRTAECTWCQRPTWQPTRRH